MMIDQDSDMKTSSSQLTVGQRQPAARRLIDDVLAVLLLLAISATGIADEPDETEASPSMHWNLPTPTLGGKQLWTDELIHGSWRIQRNAITGHYRLLDGYNIRRAWGSWQACSRKWEELKREEDLTPLADTVVVLVHGLGRSRSSLEQLGEHLEEQTEYGILNFSYASTRKTLAEDAASLGRVLDRLEKVERIHFVAHSMGNLVIRHWLGDELAASGGTSVDPRLGRIVMLAPPNNGAALARRLEGNPLFKLIFGVGGRQFTEDWEALQEHLAVPPCEFGIIAGGAEEDSGRNPLLEGNDDLIVTVEETKLAGARDFQVVPCAHTFIMNDTRAEAYTLRFLKHGHFISPQQRHELD